MWRCLVTDAFVPLTCLALFVNVKYIVCVPQWFRYSTVLPFPVWFLLKVKVSGLSSYKMHNIGVITVLRRVYFISIIFCEWHINIHINTITVRQYNSSSIASDPKPNSPAEIGRTIVTFPPQQTQSSHLLFMSLSALRFFTTTNKFLSFGIHINLHVKFTEVCPKVYVLWLPFVAKNNSFT